MGGKAKAPPPPDYSGVVAASEKAAEYNYQLGKAQLAWAKEQYGKDSEVIGKVVDAALARQATNDSNADSDRQRYESIYQPLEDKAVADANDYSSDARQQYEMGRASATVADQFEQARQNATRNLESYGIDPASTRYAALDLGTRVQQAAAQAGAANTARVQTEAMGRALRSEAINVGRGYPGQIAGTYGTALQSGNSAANAALAGTASGASTMGTGTQWSGLGNQAVNTWGNTLNAGYNNALNAAQFNAQQSSGLGGLAGAVLGAAGNAGGFGALFANGGAVDPEFTPGGNVPRTASPSGGRAVDDVDAKLTAGEFVIPKDVTSWYGEQHFQKLIEKARQSKPQAPAKPQYAAVPMGRPTFASRPAAISMR